MPRRHPLRPRTRRVCKRLWVRNTGSLGVRPWAWGSQMSQTRWSPGRDPCTRFRSSVKLVHCAYSSSPFASISTRQSHNITSVSSAAWKPNCCAGGAPVPAAPADPQPGPAQLGSATSAPAPAAPAGAAKPGMAMTECPLCRRSVPMATADRHVDSCMRQHSAVEAAAGRKRSAPSQGGRLVAVCRRRVST